jgi:hypothetical protein
MQRDLQFLSTFRERLVTEYDEQWVAVFKEAVVAHSHNLEKLMAQLRKKSISPNGVVVDYLSKEKRVLIL